VLVGGDPVRVDPKSVDGVLCYDFTRDGRTDMAVSIASGGTIAASAVDWRQAGGTLDNQGTLYVTNATGEQTDFVTIELTEGVMITSVSTGGSGGDERLTENITLHFGKFKYSFQPQDDKGKATGGTKDFTYDMQQVKGTA